MSINKIANLSILAITISLLIILVSCHEDDDNSELAGTVWIHEFPPGVNISYGNIKIRAQIIAFGDDTAEEFYVDMNYKVVSCEWRSEFHFKDGVLIIGQADALYSQNMFTLGQYEYFRTNKKFGDFAMGEVGDMQP